MDIAIQNILYARDVYPLVLFERARAYQVSVWSSRIPALNSYIKMVLNDIRPWLIEDRVERIAIALFDGDLHVLERFVFEVQMPPDVATPEDDVDMSERESIWLDDQFRSFLSRIQLMDASLGKLPDDCTFKILVHCRTSRNAVDGKRWNVAEQERFAFSENRPTKITPVRSVTSSKKSLIPGIRLQLYVESSGNKKGGVI